MAGQYPSMGYVSDSQTVLLRKICYNTAQIVDNGGGGGGAVTKLIAGTNITLDPVTGVGNVTINSTASGTANGYSAADIGGQSTLTTGNYRTYTYKATFTGAAGARAINLNPNILPFNPTLHTIGDKIRIDCVFPATPGLVVTIYQDNTQAVKLLPIEVFGAGQNFTTDGNVLSACWDFVFNGTAWIFESANTPA